MARKKGGYYGVQVGRTPGVYTSWRADLPMSSLSWVTDMLAHHVGTTSRSKLTGSPGLNSRSSPHMTWHLPSLFRPRPRRRMLLIRLSIFSWAGSRSLKAQRLTRMYLRRAPLLLHPCPLTTGFSYTSTEAAPSTSVRAPSGKLDMAYGMERVTAGETPSPHAVRDPE
jgi:hypothetical protein